MAVTSPRSFHAGSASLGSDVREAGRVLLAIEFDYGRSPYLEWATITLTIFGDHPLPTCGSAT
ncbi:MAG: hypothetical protein WCC25_17125 [Candidatus Korobacteraceae bacterium]